MEKTYSIQCCKKSLSIFVFQMILSRFHLTCVGCSRTRKFKQRKSRFQFLIRSLNNYSYLIVFAHQLFATKLGRQSPAMHLWSVHCGVRQLLRGRRQLIKTHEICRDKAKQKRFTSRPGYLYPPISCDFRSIIPIQRDI